MAKRNSFILLTDLSVAESLRRLHDTTDIAQRTMFSLSGYKGSMPVLSQFDGDRFTLWKRKYYRNDFSPYLYGSLKPEGRGSRIDAQFDMQRFVKVFMRIWLVFVALLSLPWLLPAMSGGWNADDLWALKILGAMLVFGFLLPKVGQLLGKGQERYLREFLESTLAARPSDTELPDSPRAIENKPLG